MKYIKVLNLDTEEVCGLFNLKLIGNNKKIEHISILNAITNKPQNTLTFVSDKKFIDEFRASDFKILLTSEKLYENTKQDLSNTYILGELPKLYFSKLINYIYSNKRFQYIDKKIDPTSRIEKSTCIENNVQIGKNVRIGRNCTIKKNTIIEDNSIIGDNCTIGSTGFSVYEDTTGYQVLINSIGGVLIENNVTIKNNVNIDRGTGGRFTTLQTGSAVGSNVHIGHDTNIGRSSILIDGTTIAGHVLVGKNVTLGLGTLVLQNVHIENNSKTGIGTVVTSKIPDGKFMIGNPGRIIK